MQRFAVHIPDLHDATVRCTYPRFTRCNGSLYIPPMVADVINLRSSPLCCFAYLRLSVHLYNKTNEKGDISVFVFVRRKHLFEAILLSRSEPLLVIQLCCQSSPLNLSD
eukprot:GHVN01040898.1.p1 GENE.GHVN01040898.1~~GHVN01040898.1.p1  ORF type:complete len:109 (+),score=5.17 GHVN01040898.1:729-1055(+)